jgi:hypothetical protein
MGRELSPEQVEALTLVYRRYLQWVARAVDAPLYGSMLTESTNRVRYPDKLRW